MELVNKIIKNPETVLNLRTNFPSFFDSTIICSYLKDSKYLKNYKKDLQQEFNNFEDIKIQYNVKVPLKNVISFLNTLNKNNFPDQYELLQHLQLLDSSMNYNSIIIYNDNRQAKLKISFLFFEENNPFILEMKMGFLYSGSSRISW